MAGESLGKQMVAAYSVEITGIKRTRKEMQRLDQAIHSLRKHQYSPSFGVTVGSQLGGKDIFVSKFDDMTGRIQTHVSEIMARAMALGKRYQTAALNAAETKTGAARFSGGRGGSAGRNDTGAMIHAIATNVETFKTISTTIVTGWHGWGTEGRKYFPYQEKGTKGGKAPRGSKGRKAYQGVPAANSLGHSIPSVREYLKRELGKI